MYVKESGNMKYAFKFKKVCFITFAFWWIVAIALIPVYRIMITNCIDKGIDQLSFCALVATYPAVLFVMHFIKRMVIEEKCERGLELYKEGKEIWYILKELEKECLKEIIVYDIIIILLMPGVAFVLTLSIKAFFTILIILAILAFAIMG